MQDQMEEGETQVNRVPASMSVCCSPTRELCSCVGQHWLAILLVWVSCYCLFCLDFKPYF